MRLVPILLASLTFTSLAAAEPAESPNAVGFRVGGYGFRREGDTSNTGWTQCRMNGLGVFGNRAVRGPVFVEAGLDTYFSSGQAAATDLPIDRQSALVSVAAGVRTSFTPWLRGYIQLGAGVELTRVAVPYGDAGTIRDDKVLPDGFFGVGGDLRIAQGTFLGASVRTLVMGNFDYDPARLQMSSSWVAAPKPADVFDASPGLAAQAQFYLRRDL